MDGSTTYRASLVMVSRNEKTGPIPVSTTEYKTCPPDCPHNVKEDGEWSCYGLTGHVAIHWKKLSLGERGVSWEKFCDAVRCIPKRQLWRHNQAGDLPGSFGLIDSGALDQLVESNRGRRGFTFSHYSVDRYANLAALERATRSGFTVNVSCDTLTQSDRVSNITDLPQSVVLPSTTKEHSLRTPEGRKVVVCPATYRDDMNCARCQICYDASSTRAVIGFPAHGTKKKVIDIRIAA